MTTTIEKIILGISAALWVSLIAILVPISMNHGQFLWQLWAVITGLFICGFMVCGYIHYHQKNLKMLRFQMHLSQQAASTLGNAHELVVFDSDGQTVFSSHPFVYPNKKEFLRKVMSKIAPGAEANHFKEMVEEAQRGVCLLEGGANGFAQKSKRWLAHVYPLDAQAMGGKTYALVTLTDMTMHLDGFDQTRKNYKLLEDFIDKAPFGIVYLNATNHLIALNDTFAGWIHQSKDRVIGSPLSDFVALSESNANGTSIVTIKPPKSQPFKALLFSPNDKADRMQASLICRLDCTISGSMNDSKEDDVLPAAYLESPIPSIVVELDGSISTYNKAFEALAGSDTFAKLKDDANVQFSDLLDEDKSDEIMRKLDQARRTKGNSTPFDVHFKHGSSHLAAYVSSIESPMGLTENYALIMQFIDTSEQKRLEQQFIQSQKMQAVGQLAGGIAHDFNNLLTAMIGFCDLLLQRYMPNDPSYMDIIQIKQNANRAANLVRQLLAFSRQQNLQPKVITITDTLAELSALLRRLIGANIDLKMEHGRDLWPVMVDASQLEQVIINLVVNARDAMEGRPNGYLTVRTINYKNKVEQRLGHDSMPIGDYVLVEAIDTGHGIDPATMERIFEPFFSTKEVGAGTGLGLSTVFGIVKQTGGFVGVESEVDKGTKFKIFLPRHTGEEIAHVAPVEAAAADLTGSETILLVEDEDAVRLFSARALRDKGYNVLEAENGNAALELIEAGQQFDLLITDVVMPRMDGPTLCKKIRDIYPEMKTIFISGYTEDTFRKNLGHNAYIHFLQKPFTLKDLAHKVKDVLRGDN